MYFLLCKPTDAWCKVQGAGCRMLEHSRAHTRRYGTHPVLSSPYQRWCTVYDGGCAASPHGEGHVRGEGSCAGRCRGHRAQLGARCIARVLLACSDTLHAALRTGELHMSSSVTRCDWENTLPWDHSILSCYALGTLYSILRRSSKSLCRILCHSLAHLTGASPVFV